MSERCTQGDFIFVLPYGGKIITCYYKEEQKEHIADRYMGNNAKEAKTAFEAIKAFVPIPLPENLTTVCDCTNKPCDPNSWFCHRDFVAIRFIKGHPGKHDSNKACRFLKSTVEAKDTSKGKDQ